MMSTKLFNLNCRLPASFAVIMSGWIAVSAANAADGTKDTTCNWNFERAGTAVLNNGETDPQSYSKLLPWPDADGNLIYSGCYDPAPLLTAYPGSDRCFKAIDISYPEKPRRLVEQ
jgi:hypothetical protein